jgi:RNA polymerase sigma factor (sigma-70 family)
MQIKNDHPVSVGDSPIVYIVEDDEDYRNALQLVITTAGYDVAAFANAKSLIDAYQPHRPGCCLLDLQTPGTDAMEIYQSLVLLGGAHPFIVISAHGTVPAVSQAMRSGAIDFLAKPVNHATLLERIREAIVSDAMIRNRQSERKAFNRKLATLTKRERQVLYFVVQGLPSKQIAKQLEIGANTVDVHRSNLMKKMQVDSIIQLAGLLPVQEGLRPGRGG